MQVFKPGRAGGAVPPKYIGRPEKKKTKNKVLLQKSKIAQAGLAILRLQIWIRMGI